MAKIYLEKNVLSASLERLEYIFNNFDNVYFSFSGGKDSSVMLQLANIVAKKLNKQYDVLFIDLEAQYKKTIEHIEDLKSLSNINEFYHVCLSLALRNAVSVLQPKWICWEESNFDIWVRQMPKDSININNNPFDFFEIGMEFEDFITEFANWYQVKKGGICACAIGIRADESLNRFRTIALYTGRKIMFDNKNYTTKIKKKNKELDVYNVYPIYDWSTADIWGCISQLDFKFNEIYEMMHKNGLSIHQQRLCQPYGDDQKNGLDQFKALEYETWEKVLNRVNGVNFGNIYCRTSALGNLKTTKPNFMNWEQYTIYLLESLGIYNKDLMLHYYEKIKKFIRWYERQKNISLSDIPQEADLKDESMKKAISWRRISRAIERNDFYMKRLSFGQTKNDTEKLSKLIHKWDNLLSNTKEITDKDLRRFLNEKN